MGVKGEKGVKGFVIAAAGSGSGKTTMTLGVLAWLKSRGIKVAPFKVGPDFIDPGHHTHISGRASVNLDSWMLTRKYNQYLFENSAKDVQIALVEGVMGLFDGFDGRSESGSTAQMAKILNLPVVLVVDAKGMARSAAAIVKGFESFDPDLNLAGVIFSRTGSLVHYEYLKTAVEDSCTTPVLGHMPRNDAIVMPERHLGLVTAEERRLSKDVVSVLVSMVDKNVDMDGLTQNLAPLSFQAGDRIPGFPGFKSGLRDKKPVIALAKDKAFCFYYKDNIDLLKAAGAKILEFSPLNDNGLPEGIDGIYFGGGYPEVFAKQLSTKKELLDQVRQASLSGMPIYGECGGFMFLSRNLTDKGKTFPMAGCFDFSISMSKRLRSLGYREITLKKDTIIGQKGDVIRGHEFHYSSLEDQGDSDSVQDIYQVTSRAGQDVSLKGFQIHQTLGSYMHVHFGSNPDCARHFVRSCAGFGKNRFKGC